jgi:hypothetical protein
MGEVKAPLTAMRLVLISAAALVLVATGPAASAWAADGDASAPGGNAAASQAVADEAARIVRETDLAMGHPDSKDRRGYELSLYQGKWYMPAREDVRKCIMDRESNFNYWADGGRWKGAYQMSRSLGRGALWMMKPEVKAEMGQRGLDKIAELMTTPINHWNRYWQDRAFWTIWHKGSGKSHWRGGSVKCFGKNSVTSEPAT